MTKAGRGCWTWANKKLPEERFWPKVNKSGPTNAALGTACWLWTAQVNPEGYGRFWIDDRMRPAHQVAYELATGEAFPGPICDHHHLCPKSCVRPDHLRPVSQKQNGENRVGARRDSATGIRGVYQLPGGRWRAEVRHHGHAVHVGVFSSSSAAESAVRTKRNELFTHNDVDRVLP